MFLLFLIAMGTVLNFVNGLLILKRLPRQNHYSFEVTMAIGNLNPGGTGSFAAQFLENGNPSSQAPTSVPVWSSDDASATFVTAADGLSTVMTLDAADTSTSVTVTVSATAPDGSTATGSLTVPVTPGTNVFSFAVTQTA